MYLLACDRVHADKTQLLEKLTELQRQQQQELEDLQNRLNQSDQTPHAHSGSSPLINDQNRPAVATGRPLVTTGGDERQLVEHEAALQRLVELQGTMIGGERAGDTALLQELSERRRKAEDRRELLLRASRAAEDEDGIIEGIFNSLTGSQNIGFIEH